MTGRLLRLARAAARAPRDADERHRLRARLRARWNRAAWRLRARSLRRRHPGRPLVLVGMVEHLGDVVAAEPVARHLRREMPDAYLLWAVREPYRELVDTSPHLDETLPVGCLTEWMGLARSGAFDRVVDLQIHGRDCPTCRIPLLRGPSPAVTLRDYYHRGNLLEAFCRSAGLPPLAEGPRVYVPAASIARVDALGLPAEFVVFHCTSNQAERDWDPSRWRALAEETVSAGVAVVEVGLSPTVRLEHPGYVDLCGRLSILDTAEVIRRARLFVGIDSGPAHLANAVETRGIVLLGHYGPFRGHVPYSGAYADGSNATLLRAEGPVAVLPLERVREELAARVPALGRSTAAGRA